MARAARSSAALVPLLLLGAGLGWCCWGQVRPAPVQRSLTALRAAGNAVGDGDTTPLMLAAHTNVVDEIKGFVDNGADLNAQDSYGWTALRYAVRANNVDAATVLIEAGADVNLASNSGRTPLMSAAGNGMSDMLALLLKCGADPDLVAKNGETAFRIAMRGGEMGCAGCRKMLETAATRA
mmetsp:Transcript_173276/g.550085  ORF Transcript_173276/g.550085 Transcript_173276/m.550085 type:complete len:181 (-) Transcript_173276:136-678(-)